MIIEVLKIYKGETLVYNKNGNLNIVDNTVTSNLELEDISKEYTLLKDSLNDVTITGDYELLSELGKYDYGVQYKTPKGRAEFRVDNKILDLDLSYDNNEFSVNNERLKYLLKTKQLRVTPDEIYSSTKGIALWDSDIVKDEDIILLVLTGVVNPDPINEINDEIS